MGKNSGSNFILGTIVGAAVGAATALFLAPKTGQDLRKQINDQASVVKEKTNSLSKTISEQSNQILTKVKDFKAPIGQNSEEPDAAVATTITSEELNRSGDHAKNEELFQEKLAEAQQALTEAEKHTQTNE
ncbi:YtxH domain-containing protein [Fredinandcohnia sp. QZ13]|uniref:YtxH domain-containing protein n=1 Tax=Fredinandcohnia sp. QZ13 TaxID=3073144 RepID=UPI002853615E|nr:YtxH domain-containing protein [Fredinandcohnia sp. QZ13]MDR4889269.1 YtxH domain-containing protein [Fredinandcohnia sp. QZ13]